MLIRVLFLALVFSLAGCGTVADPTSWFGSETSKVEPNELVDLNNRIKIRTLWERDIGDGTDNKRLSLAPRVDGDRVYAADSEGLVQAFNAESGSRIWSVDTKASLSGGPGSGDGLVLLGTLDGELIALDEDSGEEKWRSQLSSEILSIPAASFGMVVVHTLDGKLYGLGSGDGVKQWQYQREVPVLTLRGSSSPIISGTSVFCGFAGGKLTSLELETGKLLWEISITAPSGRSELERMVDIDGDPLVVNGEVYVATYQGEVAAVGEITGTLMWRRKLSSYSGLAADWRNLYVSDDQGEVWGINPENGAAMWKQSQLQNRRLSAPAVLDGYVVVGDFDGYLHWLSHDDGSMVARTRVGSSPITAAPVVSDTGILYVYGDGGTLAALSIQSDQ